MKDSRWPTQQELMEYVDGALDPQRFLEIDQLVSVSAALKKEIALLKMMRESIASDIVAPGRRFNANVMAQILPAEQTSVWFRLANSSSKIFAMALVLTMIGIVLTSGPGTRTSERSMISQAMDSYSTAVTSVLDGLSSRTKEYSRPLTQIGQSGSGKFLLMAAGIFFLFAAADELIGKRYSRLRR